VNVASFVYYIYTPETIWYSCDNVWQAVEKRHEEVGMHGARERGSEAYREYVEVPSELQHRRPAPQ